jgi:hypothetical protein
MVEPSCINLADAMSCAAMTDLAKNEYMQNNINLAYQLVNPSCERYRQFADREIEYDLQKTQGTHLKKECFTLPTNNQSGKWVDQFDIRRPPFKAQFDKLTRPK